MGLVVHFNPTEFDDLVRGIGQAVFLGLLGALIPKWTRERIREKEAGLEADERFEMGLDQDEDDEFGYAEGYVCGACDNTNEARNRTGEGGKGGKIQAVCVSQRGKVTLSSCADNFQVNRACEPSSFPSISLMMCLIKCLVDRETNIHSQT